MNNLLKTVIQKMKPAKSVIFSNVAEGTHLGGTLTYSASAAISGKYLFGQQTPTQGQIALAGSGNTSTGARAIGVITDEASAAGDPVAVSLVGAACGTLKALAGGAISVGDLITADINSRAVSFTAMASGAGTFYIYGIALNAAVSGECIEFVATAGLTQTK